MGDRETGPYGPAVDETFLRGIPKAELHVHIEGTLEPEMMFGLARRNGVALAYASVEEAREAYDFADFQSFLDLYYEGMGVLIHDRDFYDLTLAYLEKAASQGVRHAEIFFDPQAHTDRGVPFETAIKGIRKALVEGGRRKPSSSVGPGTVSHDRVVQGIPLVYPAPRNPSCVRGGSNERWRVEPARPRRRRSLHRGPP